MTLVLPLPHKLLRPNNGTPHHHAKAKQTRIHRNRAKLLTLSALGGQPAPVFQGYTLHFFYPVRRARDDDNASASCKAYRDGIADALRVDDTTLTQLAPPTLSIDRHHPRLEITLHPL